MPTAKLSKHAVDSLKPNGKDQFLWDTELKGFGVKLTAGGSLIYLFQYRLGGREAKTRRYTIGPHGSPWTPVTARTEAVRLWMLVARGNDPVDADKQRRREAVDLAFSNYAVRFAESCNGGTGWHRMIERSVRIYLIPVLGRKTLPNITRADVVSVFDRMPAEQIGNRRNVFAVLRRLFRWAISRGDLKYSPMEGMEVPPPVKPRERWLGDHELRLVWYSSFDNHRCFGPIVRLLMVLGQRREEVSGVDWSELNRRERSWILPGSRTKNGEPNFIPLNALAIAELDCLAGGEDWPWEGRVFATETGARYTGYAKGKNRLDQLVSEATGSPLPPWRLHDLRRTLATGFQRLGVRFEVTEAILNHVGGSRAGVAGIYQRHDWKPEKRAALDLWNEYIAEILAETPAT